MFLYTNKIFMSIARKILENTFVQVLGKLVTAALSIVVLKIITSYLGTAGYGDYTTIYQFLAFFGILADFGIYTITVKEMSRDESKIPMILGNVMGLRTFLVIFSMGLAILMAFLIPSYSDTLIPIGILIATLTTFVTLLNGTISSVLQVHLKMQYATVGLMIGKLISVLYMAWVAYIAFTNDLVNGFYHLLWSGVIGNLVMLLITAYYVRRFTKITYQFNYSYWKKIFVTALPFGVAVILNTIYFRIDIILMSFLLPHSQTLANPEACKTMLCSDTEIGLYGVAMKFLEMLVIIPVYFMNSVLPIMTKYIEQGNQKLRRVIQYSFDFLMATASPIVAGGFILAIPITHFVSNKTFLSGSDFTFGSDKAIQILVFALFFSFLNALFGITLVAMNRQIKLMYINAIAVVFNLITNLMFIPHFGFRGAAITSVFSEFIILILAYIVTKKVLGFHLSIKTLIRTLFSALLMGFVVWIGFRSMQSLHYLIQLAILVPLGGAIYIGLMFKTRAITPEMISLLKRKN